MRPPRRMLAVWAVLVAVGLGWGSAQVLAKVSVSTGHAPAAVAFVEVVICLLLALCVLRFRGESLPLSPAHLRAYALLAVLGTLIPNVLSYTALRHLPAGIVAIIISAVPMLTYGLAMVAGLERFRWLRIGGIGLGLSAVLMLALPDARPPGAGAAFWLLLPCITALSYATENVAIAMLRLPQTGALQMLAGLLLASSVALLPVVAGMDAWIDLTAFGTAEQALLALSAVHMVSYLGYIWLVREAGSVFAAQLGYVVTVSAVFLAAAFLNEVLPLIVWFALALMLAGLALVMPKPGDQGRDTPA